ncbi:hypothetical protein EV426DRAFT_344556 [Tirmania nivea]|nr:hypothetical protein EV426DRAFT_344556 [Tirmania nivea]
MKALFILVSLFIVAALVAPTNSTPKLLETLFPNYLVPVKSLQPDTPFGTQFIGTVEWGKGEVALIAGFDVPANNATNCYLKFTLPWASKNSWHVIGSGVIDYYGLARPVDHVLDTWIHRPERLPHYPLGQIKAIGGYDGIVTGSIPCHLGTRMDFELAASQLDGPTEISWYELAIPKTGLTIEMWA